MARPALKARVLRSRSSPGEGRNLEMETQNKPAAPSSRYDIAVIRPQRRAEDFKLRGEGLPAERLRKIRKALRTLLEAL